ncbi:MAG: DUF512 domain-containing protein [Oscillospiraceae bacterium]|nr:DUF512 domain-containing protein [Oscillospiraceae bacterium]
MNAIIKSINPKSPAEKTIISPGDVLRKINGEEINDVLDYKYASYDKHLVLELKSPQGKLKLVRIRKDEGVDLGLEFETYLMDKERSCANKCIFCFIDQNPKGMRQTIYYKDDDVRLSFLQGNYITLTNLSPRDIERIIKLRISPINVSMHTMDPKLREYMLGNKNAGAGIETLRELSRAGIMLNCQIVCCPGVNDGAHLQQSIKELMSIGRNINSVSVVPVGLTKHRAGLVELRPVEREDARRIIRIVGHYGNLCVEKFDSRVFFCADELYIKAGYKLPQDEFYEIYPQLENGVGMMRLLITEFEEAMEEMAVESGGFENAQFSVATGVAAKRYLTKLLMTAAKKYDRINGTVYGIRNEFYGESVTVAGLVTGGDLIARLKGLSLGSRLLIPRNMLRRGEDVFLDDVTVSDVSKALGVPVRVVEQDGADLLEAFLGR